MELNVKFFGELAELTGKSEVLLQVDEDTAIHDLEQFFNKKYDSWSLQTYLIAVNQDITKDIKLSEGDEIAFLPPFAGG